jgi:hypothetical protein
LSDKHLQRRETLDFTKKIPRRLDRHSVNIALRHDRPTIQKRKPDVGSPVEVVSEERIS